MKVGGAAKGMLDVIHQFFPLLEFFLAFFCDKGYVLPFSMDREGNEGQDQVAGTVEKLAPHIFLRKEKRKHQIGRERHAEQAKTQTGAPFEPCVQREMFPSGQFHIGSLLKKE